MKIKLLILCALIIILIVELAHSGYILDKPSTIFKKGVIIGSYDLSGKTWDEGITKLNNVFDKPIYLNAEASSRAVTLPEIGISIDRDKLARMTKTCRYSNPNIFCKNTSNEPVDPLALIKIDNEKLDKYLTALENDFQFVAKNTIISFENYTFRKLSPEAKITIDKIPFATKEEITKLIDKNTIKLNLNVLANDDGTLQQQETERLIQQITRPLLIKYGGTPLYIPREVIQTFIGTEQQDKFLLGKLQDNEIDSYLKDLEDKYASEDVQILQRESIQAIKHAILFRAADQDITQAVILPIKGKPRTHGELHPAYLEVIKSQQRLYRFENGELVKTYVISTGLTWDTPAGTHKVLGKQKMTISYSGNWYMPYYLPVGTIFGKYRFGFHAIPYHMDAAGNIYSRDENTMGSPATGGCIQLHADEAKELFEWAHVGMPVYIYE